MSPFKHLAATLLAVSLSIPVVAQANHNPGGSDGIGWGPGTGPGWEPGRGPQPGRGWPQPPSLPPHMGFGLCEGSFAGTFEDGRNFFLSVSGEGDVTVSAQLDSPFENLMGQGTCEERDGQATLSISLDNGYVETGTIYVASDNQVYMDGIQSDGTKFVMQKQQ